jgi:hypothetical protein
LLLLLLVLVLSLVLVLGLGLGLGLGLPALGTLSKPVFIADRSGPGPDRSF